MLHNPIALDCGSASDRTATRRDLSSQPLSCQPLSGQPSVRQPRAGQPRTRAQKPLLNLVGCWGLVVLSCVANAASAQSVPDQTPHAHVGNVLLVTLDGLRWQEVFGGADERLVSADGHVKDIAATQSRFLGSDAADRRSKLMPFFWSTIADQGVVIGNPDEDSSVRVTNTQHFSYPGYSELLCGFADPQIDSNAKTYNSNVTVLEWLNRKPDFAGRVAAFCSWDVFPYILNDQRSGVFVNAGWSDTSTTVNEPYRSELEHLDQLANEVPHLWPSVRYDYFTFRAAETYLRAKQPRVLYVSFGETDDWAHEGRYDLYLDSAQRNDDYVRRLWNSMQSMAQYRDNTTLIITSDHGRGDGRTQWTSHKKSIPGCDVIWLAMLGPGLEPRLSAGQHVTQSQVAATIAECLGLDFVADHPQAAPALTFRRPPSTTSTPTKP